MSNQAVAKFGFSWKFGGVLLFCLAVSAFTLFGRHVAASYWPLRQTFAPLQGISAATVPFAATRPTQPASPTGWIGRPWQVIRGLGGADFRRKIGAAVDTGAFALPVLSPCDVTLVDQQYFINIPFVAVINNCKDQNGNPYIPNSIEYMTDAASGIKYSIPTGSGGPYNIIYNYSTPGNYTIKVFIDNTQVFSKDIYVGYIPILTSWNIALQNSTVNYGNPFNVVVNDLADQFNNFMPQTLTVKATQNGILVLSQDFNVTAKPSTFAFGSNLQPGNYTLDIYLENILRTSFQGSVSSTPVLADYNANASVTLAGNTTITPVGNQAPVNTTSAIASTTTDFKGKLEVNPTTGVVRVTNAHPVGTYPVTVTAFNGTESVQKTFTLTVQPGPACSAATIFTNAADVSVGLGPRSVAIGDFNGDGKQDIAATRGLNNVSIRLGDGTGGFSGTTNVSVGDTPHSVAIGDFNGDGKQDFATANFGADSVSIRLGDGTGNFSGTTEIGVGKFPIFVAIGDFNGDGKQDFATANDGDTTVSIRLGDGTGNFSGMTEVNVGSRPQSIAIGDFNSDGKQDFAAATPINTISIRLGDGTGNFTGTTSVTVGSSPVSVAIGDFNGDGKQDFAAANGGADSVSIRLGDGTGNFSGTTDIGVGDSPRSVAIGDFNGDGKQDFAAANENSDSVSIRLGDGLGSFSGTTNVSVGDAPRSVAIGDFNGDGRQDFATANIGIASSNVSIRLGGCDLPPMLTPIGILRTAGASGNSQIATASDARDALNTLAISISSDGMTFNTMATLNGVTVTLTDSNAGAMGTNPDAMGQVFAAVVAACTATSATFKLRVTDSSGQTDTKDFSVTVNPHNLGITLGASPSVVQGTTSANLPYTATTGSANQYRIDYDTAAEAAGFVDVAATNLPASPIALVVPGMAAATTYNATLTVLNGTTGCASSSVPFTVTVLSCPSLFTVNDSGDTADANPGNTVCADANGKCTLRAAIQEANAISPCTPLTINFSVTGTIALTAGELVITHPHLTIQGPGADLLSLSGNNASRVFYLNSGASLALDNLTVTKGTNPLPSNSPRLGGGIYNDGGTLTITNSIFSENKAFDPLGNASGGGGLYNDNGSVTITNSTFSGNSATGYGGSILVGGGIYSVGGTLTIKKSAFTGNYAAGPDVEGGAIYNHSTAVITNSTFSGNYVRGGNTISLGGAIANYGNATLTNCTMTGNSASEGRYVFGGGIYNSNGTVNARNTIIAGNTATTGPDVHGTLSSRGHNLLGNQAGTTITPTTGDQLGGGSNPVLDPKLGPLANNGGPTQTHRLLLGSPALNAGNSCVLTANGCSANDPVTALTTDQRGFNRQVGSAVDIGAFEANYTLATTGGNNQSTTVNTAFATALQATLTESGNAISGVPITFSAPGSGASATLGTPNPATTDASGQARVNATANASTGSYQVTASAAGLTAVAFNLTNICAQIAVTGVTPVLPTCFGATNGSLTINAMGGTGALRYSLNGGQTFSANPQFTGLGAGLYQIVVQDANQCASTLVPFALQQPAALGFMTAPVNPTCNGATNGSLTINATGGTGTLLYSLNNGQTFSANPQFTGLGAGTYQVLVKDANNCQTQASSVTLTQPSALTFTTTPVNPTCLGAANGSLTINATGGTGALLYSLNNGQSFSANPQFNNLGAGVYQVLVKDANQCASAAQSVTLTQPAALALSPAALVNAVAGQPFTQSFTPSGGTGAKSLSLQGSLPNWLSFNAATATLGGTAPQPASVSFSLTVSDQAGCTATFLYTLNFVCPTITLAPATLPNGVTGAPYAAQSLSALPDGTAYSFAITQGQLPPGLTFSNGSLSGTPTAAGSFTFVVTATGWANGQASCAGTRTYTLVVTAICPALTVNPASLPGGTVGSNYNQSLSATGGSGPYTYAVTGGALPGGLTLNAAGSLSGMPTQSGTYSFTATVTGAGGCTGSRSYTLTIACPALNWTPASLPQAQAGVAYNQTVTATGAASYSVQTGNLPSGLALNAATGVLSGMATAAGTYNFTVQATAAGGCSGTRAYTLTVTCPAVTLSPTSLPAGTVNTAYEQSLSATPAGNYSFARTGGSLPPGLTLSAAGVLSGTPTTAGSYTFTVTATGFGTCTGTRQYTVTINAACTTISLPSLPAAGTVGVNYTGNLAGTTPSGSYTFSVESGALPPGLVLDNLFAALVGKPTTAGSYQFTLKATRNNGCMGTRAYTVTINSAAAALAQLGDYDGDGKADLTLWSGASGRWQILRSRDEQTQTPLWGMAGDLTLLGDYDGDGQTDVAVFRPANGTWYVRKSSDGAALVQAWGTATDVPVPGDYDGDGKTDLALWRPGDGNWYVRRSRDGGYTIAAWGLGAAPYLDVPVPGDYDGDRRTDLAVFRRQTGTWLIKRSSDGQFTVKVWGLGSDQPVVGDYDGDGKSDVAVWRGATGQWFVWRSSSQSYAITAWGTAGDVPVVGDYDGDGCADLMVWRAGAQTWYVRCSQDGRVRMQVQGQAAVDRPVTARP
jgi:CSLREA domain-containing protein